MADLLLLAAFMLLAYLVGTGVGRSSMRAEAFRRLQRLSRELGESLLEHQQLLLAERKWWYSTLRRRHEALAQCVDVLESPNLEKLIKEDVVAHARQVLEEALYKFDLANGGYIKLFVWGEGHPPVGMQVVKKDQIKELP